MIHRAILRQCRVVGSSLRVAPRAALLEHQSTLGRSFTQPFPKITAARWYATEPEIKRATDGEAEVAEQTKSGTAQAEDSLNKELEVKNKEIADLKVRRYAFL